MSSIRSRLAMTACVLAAAAFAGAASAAQAPLNPKAITITPFDKLKFEGGPHQPLVHKVYGDPAKAGPYAIIIRWRAHDGSRPHMHPNDRFVTVLEGTWWVSTGTKFDPASATPVKPGQLVVHKANEVHYDGARDEDAVILITGMGPAPSIDKEVK